MASAAVIRPSISSMASRLLALVPLRSFVDGKSRLADHLDDDARSALTRDLAAGVLDVLTGLAEVDTVVVTSDDEIARWARDRRVVALGPDEVGLNEAAAFGHLEAAERGYDFAAVVHADLAHPDALPAFFDAVLDGPDDSVWIAPDLAGDGTNVLVVPTDAVGRFDFAYGQGSADRHEQIAQSAGLTVERWVDDRLGIDIDTGDDLAALADDRLRRQSA